MQIGIMGWGEVGGWGWFKLGRLMVTGDLKCCNIMQKHFSTSSVKEAILTIGILIAEFKLLSILFPLSC
jgi:hypothetical protein